VFAAIEKDKNCKNGFSHLVFYVRVENRDVELTIDHIIPKALNGENNDDNYQLLCEECNRKKGDKLIVF
jgi:5-methylcytosine-specific restriction endonuclease McrA